jgi:hypothetical protein
MSTIFEKQDKSQSAKIKDQRRSYRAPLAVMGATVKNGPFPKRPPLWSLTLTERCSCSPPRVAPTRTLSIADLSSESEVACRVVHNRTTQRAKTEIAVTFETPSPLFWKSAFPSTGRAASK